MYQQLSEISPAISEIVVDGEYHYPSKVSQEAAAVLYPRLVRLFKIAQGRI